MDTKNVIAAISLSAAVIILYSLFFAPPPITKENLAEKNKTEQNDAPSLDQKETATEITREEALNQNIRIQFENQNIVGSISLKVKSSIAAPFKAIEPTIFWFSN